MANQNLSQFTEKLFVADADHTFIWDSAASISKRVSRNSWLSGTTADFHLGLADAASPVAQTISVQSVVAGTTNTAGANLSINGSQGTGTGAGGSLLLRTAPAGSSGTTQNALVTALAITSAGNVGIGTTAPGAKLHVAGNSSPSITVDNTLATGASQLLFKNTVVTGDTDGIFLNGSAQAGFGGNGSLNIKATTGPIAFHTASVTNALSIAQTGAATFSQGVTFNNDIYGQRDVYSGNGRYFRFANATALSSSAVGLMLLSDLTAVNLSPRMAFGGVDATFPAIKRSTVRIQAVLANDSGFTNIQGKLTTDTDYTAGSISPTGFLTLYDAQGNAYKVPCVAA
jgi:hypothetical protein